MLLLLVARAGVIWEPVRAAHLPPRHYLLLTETTRKLQMTLMTLVAVSFIACFLVLIVVGLSIVVVIIVVPALSPITLFGSVDFLL